MFLKHPLTLGLTLILQTLLICAASSISTSFTWFSYILFIIFVGATLVLFIYVASLAPNEIISLSPPLALITTIPLLTIPILLIIDQLIYRTKVSRESSFTNIKQTSTSPLAELRIIYNPPITRITAFVIIYLLITLLVVVKLTPTFSGPLRLS